MLCNMRKYAAALMLAVLGASPAFGQTGYIPNGAGPATAPATGLNPPLPSLVSGQATALPVGNSGTNGCVFCNQSAGQHCNPYEDNNGPLLNCNPCLDSPSWAPPGWFSAVELDLVGSHIKNRLEGQVGSDTIHLPTAELDWTVSPRIELGYRFAQGAGELLLAYKFQTNSGSETLANFDPAGNAGNLHSRLNINAWDIDYGSREYGLWPCCDMRWRAGVRLAGVFFDSTDNSPLLEEREANYYFGAGPHIGLDLRRFVMGTGLQFIGRVESAFLMGQTRQTFEEDFVSVRSTNTLIAPWVGVQAGVGWVPPGLDQLTVSAGYTLECWWDMADVGSSRGDITSQGVFFRAELRY